MAHPNLKAGGERGVRCQWRQAALLLLCLAALPSCRRPTDDTEATERSRAAGIAPGEQGRVLATVGQEKITARSLADELAQMEPSVQARFASSERKRNLLDTMIQRELLAQQARREGLEQDPRVERHVRRAMAEQLLKVLRADLVKLSDIRDEDVRRYYHQHSGDFGTTDAGVRPFSAVENEIRNQLLTERREAAVKRFVAGLRKQARIEINEAELSRLREARRDQSRRDQGVAQPELDAGTTPARDME